VTVDRSTLAERSFERLAEQQGDITQGVIDNYYRDNPGTRESFDFHGLGNRPDLEGRMVAETVFMLMQWAVDPAGTKISQGTTICHHQDTLHVGPHWYIGLIDAVLAALWTSIPQDAQDERDMWVEIRAEIAAFIESLRAEFIREDEAGPLHSFEPRDPQSAQ